MYIYTSAEHFITTWHWSMGLLLHIKTAVRCLQVVFSRIRHCLKINERDMIELYDMYISIHGEPSLYGNVIKRQHVLITKTERKERLLKLLKH